MKKPLFSTLVFILFLQFSVAQTVSGYVTRSEDGEPLIGCNIYNLETLEGTTSNLYGFYSFTLPVGEVKLSFSYVGLERKQISLDVKNDTTLNIALNSINQLEEVEIVANRKERIEDHSQMSSIDVPLDKIKTMPVLLGEQDVLKTIQLLPGVQSGSEGSSGIYVRGGGPDQNLILLDGVPVYNASHLFGFFSVFNADAINSVQLIKGGYPARYGGRLSSVLDIRMKEGNSQEFHGEGPIRKDKTSFIFSGRRTYADIFAKPLIQLAAEEDEKVSAGYYFYDINFKINHKFSENSRLYLSVYSGKDDSSNSYGYSYDDQDGKYSSDDKQYFGWGNLTTALRWNKVINNKLFSNTTLTYSQYQFDIGQNFEETSSGQKSSYAFNYTSGINDWAGKIDFDYIPNTKHYVKFGIGDIYHSFKPGVSTNKQSELDTTTFERSFEQSDLSAHEFYAYLEDDFKINPRLKVNAGIHFSGFNTLGKIYTSIQPIFSSRYTLKENWSLKASYASMTQFIHLLTNSTLGLPTDLWLPVTDRVPPQNAWQTALGVAHT